MTGNAINAKSEALELRELSSEELNAVSGGLPANWVTGTCKVERTAGQNDPAQMFQQILQQLTQG
jgi:hypothetical protein